MPGACRHVCQYSSWRCCICIAAIPCRLRFWVDIIAWLPFDYAIVEAIWPPCYVSNTARYVSLLKLLRLVRTAWHDQHLTCQPVFQSL